MTDVRDVILRIESHLTRKQLGHVDPAVRNGESRNGDESVILVAHEILPSQAMSLGDLPIAGIVTELGGSTSHAAILARSRGIPAVSGVEGIMGEVESGDLMIVDGRDGMVLVRPDQEATSAYRKVQREFFNFKDRLVANRDLPAKSADGTQVELLANINNLADAQAAHKVGADRRRAVPDRIPVPDPPRRARRGRAIRVLPPDHPQLAQPDGHDPHPRPGRRQDGALPGPAGRAQSVHGLAVDPDLLRELQAVRHPDPRDPPRRPAREGLDALPDDHHARRAAVRQQAWSRRRGSNLRREGVAFGEDVKTGVMVEVPAAAVCIDAILRETDFISIGSNDLIQYLVAADRDNPKVAHLCESLSPAIFRVLQMVLDACQRTGTPVTLCGEMAGQPRSVLVLFGMGLRRFSMSPAFIPTVKDLLASVTTAQAERFAHHVLQLNTSEEIRSYLTARLHEVSSTLEVFDTT